MSDDAYGATVAKRRLARRLTDLRRSSGHTANHVCDLLDWGRGKVGRFEANHWKRPEMSDIRDLLRVYGVDDGVITADEAGWERTVREMRTLIRSEDAREGPLAFAEKREPAWVTDPLLKSGG